MTDELVGKTCTPCRGGIPPLTRPEAENLMAQTAGWGLSESAHEIHRSYKFKNFAESLEFVNKVGDLAEHEGHHPDVAFGWGYATVSLQTKKIKGLHENDFIMAVKINEMASASD
jgi:4a-hydroxytetrahydrobiopterin dehydratase